MLWSVLHFYRQGYGCLESERSALLEIKAAFTPWSSSSLNSWGRSADCCSWDMVRCETATGRVIRLRLDNILGTTEEDDGITYFHLNSSLFLPFQQLRSLSLSSNNIKGCLQNQGLERLSGLPKLAYLDLSVNWMDDAGIVPSVVALSSLKALSLRYNHLQTVSGFRNWSQLSNLEYLDLSWNEFNESIIPDLARISSLKALSLADNYMSGMLQMEGFRNWSQLSKLEYLDLSENNFNASIIPDLARISSLKTLSLARNYMSGMLQMEEFRKLSNLEELDLEGNIFFGSIQPFVEEWASLKVLHLNDNQLNATLSPHGLCKLKNLQMLDLSENQLTGNFPSCIGNLTSLRYLDISDNQLQVNFLPNFLANLTSLEYIFLSNNQLQGTFLLASLSNHSNLKALELADSRNNLVVETEDPIATPLYQLKHIVLSMCNLNKGYGTVPSFLSSQYALNWVVLSHNNLRGSFPSWLLENKTVLHVDLQNNSFNGPLVLPNHVNTNISELEYLNLSMNEFSEEIPTDIGVLLPNLLYLNLSRNHLRGSIPSSFDHFLNLAVLDLSNNSLSGEVSNVFGNSSLRLLDISGNMFRGRLPLQNPNMDSSFYLVLSGNQFTGDIPSNLCNYSYLDVFDITENQVSGTLPNCMEKIGGLRVLSAEENLLEGYIPTSLCTLQWLRILNLSKNRLSGTVPHCFFNLTELQYLHLSHNGLTGSFPIGLSNSSAMMTLDLGNNHLSGELPGWIGKALRETRMLLLKGNRLGGPIPNQVCQLKHLRILDLSQNLLSGEIPACIKYIGYEESAISPFLASFGWSYGRKPFAFPSYLDIKAEKRNRDTYALSNRIVEVAEFTIKSRYDTYRGFALNYWTLLDLSCNQLVGHIPLGIGDLGWLQSLNLSNNHLTGPIPATLSGLKGIQSLDLSHNALTGRIPPQLLELYSLAVFSVAHNRLSGPTPRMEPQFSTFGESSYEGNPDLCGPPLKKNCTSPRQPGPSYDHEGDDGAAVDSLIFFASFALAYIMGFWGSIAVLYFKTSWRSSLFLASDRYTVKVRELLAKHRRRCW